MRKRVYLSPCPGVAVQGVIVGKFLMWVKVLYRDLDGICKISWEPNYKDSDFLLDRP